MSSNEYDLDERIRKFLVSNYTNTSIQVWKKLPTEKSKKYPEIFVYKHLLIGTVSLVSDGLGFTVINCIYHDDEENFTTEILSVSELVNKKFDKKIKIANNTLIPIKKERIIPQEYIVPKIVKLTPQYYKSYLTQVFKRSKPNEWKMVDKYSNQLKEKIFEFNHSIIGNIAVLRKEDSIVIDKPDEKIKLIMNNKKYIYGLSRAHCEMFSLNDSTLIYITNKDSWLHNKTIDSIENIDLKRIFGVNTTSVKIFNMIVIKHSDIGYYTKEALEKYLNSIGIFHDLDFSKHCQKIPIPSRKPKMINDIEEKLYNWSDMSF